MKRIVKHLLMPLMAAALILSGCCTKSELEEVKQEVSSLTERVASIENTQLKALESQIASIQKEIAELQNADKVQAEDVSALEGKMSVISDDLAQLKESVSSLDGTTEELSGKIAGINAKLSELESQITSILASINELKARVSSGHVTLSYIPKYADNNEPVNYTRDVLKISGTATLNFNVLPSSAAETIANDWKTSLSTIAVYTLTKATGGESVELAVSDASAKDGILSVKIDVDKLGKDFILGDIGAALAVKVSCSDIQIFTDYINLSPVVEEKAFIEYLLNNFDTDGDGQVNDMDKVTSLDVSGYGLTTIDDILSQMPALESLDCSKNTLKSIDLSKNTALTTLSCSGNELTSIDLSQCPALTTLNCNYNSLSSLDLSKNPALTTLNCSNNQLTSLDLSKNENLTSAYLSGNANLTKVVCKSLDWFLGCSILWTGSSSGVLLYTPDGTQIGAVIDGKTWMQYNVGASEANLYGDHYNFDDAQSACPTGWRVPTSAELSALSAHHSDWTTYFGVKGYWFSGSQTYSPTAPAIFLPVYSSNSSSGFYWSSSEDNSGNAYRLYFYSGDVNVFSYTRSPGMSVRCLKD